MCCNSLEDNMTLFTKMKSILAYILIYVYMGFHGGSESKESAICICIHTIFIIVILSLNYLFIHNQVLVLKKFM